MEPLDMVCFRNSSDEFTIQNQTFVADAHIRNGPTVLILSYICPSIAQFEFFNNNNFNKFR